MLPFLLVAALVIWAAGCGFRLRGAIDLPESMSRVHIAGIPEYSDFATELRRNLRANGVEVVGEPGPATATLRITENRRGRRILAVNEKGKALEYELFSVVSFQVRGPKNKTLLDTQTLHVTRDFIFDENQVLGKVTEAETIYRDMEEDIIRLMMYRLRAIPS